MNKLSVGWSFIKAHLALKMVPDLHELYRVLVAYSEDHRFYHTLTHIRAAIKFVNDNYPEVHVYERSLVIMALIYHDIVYDPMSSTNEEDSAKWWTLYGLGRINNDALKTITRLIIMTKSHKLDQSADELEKMMNDADMSILASEEDVYMEYAQNIWREYRVVGRETYLTNRIKFLSSVDVDSLFHTEAVSEIMNPAINLARELELLRERPDDILVD